MLPRLDIAELLRREGSNAPAAVGVGLGLGSRPEHVERPIAAIRELASDGPCFTCTHNEGGYWEAGARRAVLPQLQW